MPAGEDAVLDLHVADAAGHFGAETDGGVDGALQAAVADDHILRGPREALRGQAASRFQRDGVVTGVDVAMLDGHAVAGIHIHAVAVGVHGAEGEVAGGQIFAEQQVDGPELLVLRGEIFQHGVGAAGQFDQHRAARVAELAEGNRRTENRAAGEGDVGGVGRGDQGAVALAKFALPADVHDGVIRNVRTAEQVRVRGQLQRGVGVQDEAAGQINPLRHQHRAAAVFGAGVERFLDGGGVLRQAVALRAKIKDIQCRFLGGQKGRGQI